MTKISPAHSFGIAFVAAFCTATGATWAADYRLPRPTGLTVSNAMFECVDPEGCSIAVACSTDHPVRFEDYDFADASLLDDGGVLQTTRRWRINEVCVARAEGSVVATGLRYMKLKAKDDRMHYAGVAEVPMLLLEGGNANVGGDHEMSPQPFVVVLVDTRVVDAAPRADMELVGQLVRKVLGRMGFIEQEDYRLVTSDYDWDITDVTAEVLEQGSSGPATNRFRKSILEATSYVQPRGHGLVYVGAVSEWPTGRDHGSYMLAGPDVQFVSFCNGTTGFLTCSVKEDCLGHELGHAFGMQHERHNWYGFAPTQEQIDAMRRMTRCAPEADRPHELWSEQTLELLRD